MKHVFCCWGHHILKKSKWWGMPACALQLGWPQTSDEQSGAMRCRAWLPLLGTQWPLWPKVCAASQLPELHKASCYNKCFFYYSSIAVVKSAMSDLTNLVCKPSFVRRFSAPVHLQKIRPLHTHAHPSSVPRACGAARASVTTRRQQARN